MSGLFNATAMRIGTHLVEISANAQLSSLKRTAYPSALLGNAKPEANKIAER